MVRRRGVLGAVLVLALGAGALGLQAVPGAAQTGATVTIAQPADAVTLDPQKEAVAFTDNILVNVFEPLIRRDPYQPDPAKALQPWLAVSWREYGPDKWQVKLRPGVHFQDGEELTADVVKFSFERIIDPATKSPAASLYGTLSRVDVVDKYTVNFVTKAPDPIWPSRLAGDLNFVVPKAYIQQKGDAYFAQHPVGTGPYRFVQWQQGEQVVLEANPDYWGGEPKQVSRLVFKPIPDAATRVAALESGAVDIINEVPVALLSTLAHDPRVYVTSAQGSDGLFFIGADMRFGGPLANEQVRQAMNYAVNVDSIVKNVMEGQAIRVPTLVGPYTWGYAALTPYPYDPDKAKQLLAQAGYANGFDVNLNTSPTRWSEGPEIIQAVASDLGKVGIRAKIQNTEWGAYVDMLWSNKPHDLYIRTWSTADKLDADTPLFLVLHTGVASSTYVNPDVDKLLDAERDELRPSVRMDLFRQIQQKILEDPMGIYMFAENANYAVSRRLQWSAPHDYRMWLTSLKVVGR